MSGIRILPGDCRDVLQTLPADSVQCVVTSPPYYGLRDYGVANQIGLEPSPDEYLATMVAVFREVRRVLRDDGTCWVNMGDSYNAMPARLAIALQADGWWLRSEITWCKPNPMPKSVWAKPNPMPESVTDLPTSAHEHIFLLAKSPRYFYDAVAISERVTGAGVATAPYAEAHFATFPPALAERCIKAGSRIGDTILDPFAGAGTTLLVADRLQRNAIGIELNPAYTEMAMARCVADAPLFTSWPPADDPADARMADLFAGHGT